jgi:hypothetical protein
MWPLPRDDRSLNVDWIADDVQGVIAGTCICILGVIILTVLCRAVGDAISSVWRRR